jgi:hypothetical protein
MKLSVLFKEHSCLLTNDSNHIPKGKSMDSIYISPVVSLGIFFEATDVTMCSAVDSASKNEYQENSWRWRRPVRKGDDITTFVVPNVETIQEP